MQNEKDALESTVKALSSKATQDGRRKQKLVGGDSAQKNNDDTHSHSGAERSLGEFQTKTNESPSSDQQGAQKEDEMEELDQLNEKLSTLSKALSTVTEEKSKMAAAFQADKKLAIVSYTRATAYSEICLILTHAIRTFATSTKFPMSPEILLTHPFKKTSII